MALAQRSPDTRLEALTRILYQGERKIMDIYYYNQLQKKTVLSLLQFALFGFMNNILSATKYRVSLEGACVKNLCREFSASWSINSKSLMQAAG